MWCVRSYKCRNNINASYPRDLKYLSFKFKLCTLSFAYPYLDSAETNKFTTIKNGQRLAKPIFKSTIQPKRPLSKIL